MSLTTIVTKYGKEYPIDKSKWFKEEPMERSLPTYRVAQARKVTIMRPWEEDGNSFPEEVNTYKLESGELVIYHPEYEEYLDATGEIYQPVGADPVEGFVNVGCTTLPATTREEDVFYLVGRALESPTGVGTPEKAQGAS